MRSFLFVPGNNPSMIQNADVFDADVVIFDLEDSVHAGEKDNARNLLSDYLSQNPMLPKKIAIRINAPDSPFYEADLLSMVSDKIDFIVFPKASVQTTQKLGSDLFQLEQIKQMEKKIDIIPIIELASSLVEASKIASASRVRALLFGAEDYCSDLEIKRTLSGEALFYPRSVIAVACKAYGLIAIDTPFTDVRDDIGLEQDAKTAVLLGLNAKAAIHPRQIQIINRIFSPQQDQLDWALKVIEAEKIANKKGLGVFSLDGKMIDKPIIERARKTLLRAKEYGLLGDLDEE
ncbi:MAG: HpcH/HpaI aldolase/citrate lyase family protein [Candidatus Izemoplasmatales bacterium]|jgi:citrate lyase subunit beta/citryl-CoA lyase